jgi:hypothetical protein
MILRALEPSLSHDQNWHPAWPVVERIQRQRFESCWMITQPSHAALAGEIAAKLQSPPVPQLDEGLIRAIALHDAGWGMPDAQAIMHSRAQHGVPKSFLELGIADFLSAWSQSIETAQSASPAGGYIVSRHFWRLAEHRLAHGGDDARPRKELQGFVSREDQRQRKLASKQDRNGRELEALTDVLQFCDLLSLYICSGARDSAEFPEYCGVVARVRVEDRSYFIEPNLVEPGSQFRVAALRHPPTSAKAGEEIEITIL